MKDRLRKIRFLRPVLDIQDRFNEVGGGALASGIALSLFLSLLPLLLVAIAVVGFVSQGDTGFAREIINNLGLKGEAAEALTDTVEKARESRRAASAFGLLGLLWTGINVATGMQRAVDRTWQVQGDGIRDKARAFGWLVGAAVIFIISFGLSAFVNFLPGWLSVLSIIAGVATAIGLFWWTYTMLGRQPVRWKEMLPGAIFCGVGFEVLKLVGSIYVPRAVASSSALYGSLGVVFATIAWLMFFGRLFVYGSVINVLRFEAAHGTDVVPLRVPSFEGHDPEVVNRSGDLVDVPRPGEDPAQAKAEAKEQAAARGEPVPEMPCTEDRELVAMSDRSGARRLEPRGGAPS